MILLDTDVIIEVLDKKSVKGEALMLRVIESWEEYCTSSVNMNELLYGVEKYSKDSRLACRYQHLDTIRMTVNYQLSWS